jgi:hypothetical protein
MKHQTLDQIRTVATVHSAAHAPAMSRRERLERWATLLEQHGAPLRSLYETEFTPVARRRAMRRDGSPLTVAFDDPVLRGQGLRGDTYGEAMDFFALTHSEMHRILCYCHCGDTISSELVSERIRFAAAEPAKLSSLVTGLWIVPVVALGGTLIAAFL